MPFGQQVLATGGNLRAAAYAGIKTGRVRFLSLVLAGTCAAMAGIINVAYFRSFNPVAGQFRELDAIAAVIIGGTLLSGGRGTLIGSILGVLVFTVITNLFVLNNLDTEVQNIAKGVIIVVAVLIQARARRSGP